MRNVKVLASLLVVSLIVNAYLIATRSSGGSERATASPAATTAASGGRGGFAPAPRPPALSGGAGEAQSPEQAKTREAELTARLLKSQAEAEQHRPLPERFAQGGERSPEIEDQVRPVLDKVFPVKPGEKPPYSVECHGYVCSLKVNEDLDTDAWMHALQSQRAAQIRSFAFGVAGTFFEVGSPEYVAGRRYAQSVLDAIRESPGVAECKQRFPTPGTVVLSVVLDDGRRVRVAMEGNLADQDLGACLRPICDRAVAQLPLPATVASIPRAVTIVRIEKPAPPAQRGERAEHMAAKDPVLRK